MVEDNVYHPCTIVLLDTETVCATCIVRDQAAPSTRTSQAAPQCQVEGAGARVLGPDDREGLGTAAGATPQRPRSRLCNLLRAACTYRPMISRNDAQRPPTDNRSRRENRAPWCVRGPCGGMWG